MRLLGETQQAHVLFLSTLFSIFDGGILCDLWANIVGAGTDETVVGVLLQNVCGPTCCTATGEDWRIEVDGNTKRVVDRGGIEIDVGVEMLMFQHVLLNDARYLVPACIMIAFA